MRNDSSKIYDFVASDEMVASNTLFLLVEYIMTSQVGILF